MERAFRKIKGETSVTCQFLPPLLGGLAGEGRIRYKNGRCRFL